MNELADSLAKAGTRADAPKETIPTPKAWINQLLEKEMMKKWNLRWTTAREYRQTKLFFPTIKLNEARWILRSPRDELSRLIQVVTGHAYVRYHQRLVYDTEEDECRLCNEDTETAWHIVSECPALERHRREVFGFHYYTPTGVASLQWTTRSLRRFLHEDAIMELLTLKGRSDTVG